MVLRVLDPCFSYFHHWPVGVGTPLTSCVLVQSLLFMIFSRAVHLKPMFVLCFLINMKSKVIYICKDIQCNVINVVTLRGGMSSDNIHLNPQVTPELHRSFQDIELRSYEVEQS